MGCCDGTCLDMTADNENCGGCDFRCPSDEGCCGGACTDLQTESNCHSCGRSCSWDELCTYREGCRSRWDIFWDSIF
jgi:hypothetical protein